MKTKSISDNPLLEAAKEQKPISRIFFGEERKD
jgi:hypothetical protein